MAVEPPLRVESREELVWLLTQASELEQGLMMARDVKAA
jgi:hypothetical protein